MTAPACGIITQARAGGSRLPGKVLMEVGGKTVLEHHLHRLAESALPVIVATTEEPGASRIVEICESVGVPCFVGATEDVLARFYHCADEFNLDVVVRATSDCPLVDGRLIREGLDSYLEMDDDLAYMSATLVPSLPRGFDFEVFSFLLLEEAFQESTHSAEREHVTPYLYLGRNPNVRLSPFTVAEDSSDLSVTLDTPKDLELIRVLIEEHGATQLSAEAIIALLRTSPDLAVLNASEAHKTVPLSQGRASVYRCLPRQRVALGGYSLIPLRRDDLAFIKEWRNAQMDVLRQKEPLTDQRQQEYWSNVVAAGFDEVQPREIILSFFEEGLLIGYGGLVHIDWTDSRAEVSFLTDPRRAKNDDQHASDLSAFLELIKRLAFRDLGLRRLTTETYAGRTGHLAVLESEGFELEGRLREHVLIGERHMDALLHGCLRAEHP